MVVVPVRRLLIGMRQRENGRLGKWRAADLQPDRKAAACKTARDRDGGQPVHVKRGRIARASSRSTPSASDLAFRPQRPEHVPVLRDRSMLSFFCVAPVQASACPGEVGTGSLKRTCAKA